MECTPFRHAAFQLAGQQQAVFVRSNAGARVQVGGAAFDSSMSAKSLFLHGDGADMANLQAGGTTFALGTEQQSMYLRSDATTGAKVQVGGPDFDSGIVPRSVWVHGGVQVGRSGAATPTYDGNIPDGGMLTGEQIRSSGGIRARGQDIVLAGGEPVLNRAWDALQPASGDLDGGERLALRTTGGDIRFLAGGERDANDFVMIDSEDVFVEELNRIDRTLTFALPSFVSDAVAYDSSATVTCYGAGAPVQYVGATGWYRRNLAGTRTYTVTITVGSATDSSTFQVPVPYSGWSINRTTGADDGRPSGAGETKYSRVVYCDYL